MRWYKDVLCVSGFTLIGKGSDYILLKRIYMFNSMYVEDTSQEPCYHVELAVIIKLPVVNEISPIFSMLLFILLHVFEQ